MEGHLESQQDLSVQILVPCIAFLPARYQQILSRIGASDLQSHKGGSRISLGIIYTNRQGKGRELSLGFMAGFGERDSYFYDLPWGKGILISVACLRGKTSDPRAEGQRRSGRDFNSLHFGDFSAEPLHYLQLPVSLSQHHLPDPLLLFSDWLLVRVATRPARHSRVTDP